MKSGIYMWTCVPNGKKYVGSAVDLHQRRSVHLSCLRAGDHHSIHFQRAWDKHGEASFRWKVLLVCAPADLLFYEQRVIDVLGPELNIARVAGSSLGVKHTEETKAKLRAAFNRPEHKMLKSELTKAQMRNPTRRQALIDANTGKKASLETRKKLSDSHMGKKPTDLTRQKLSASQKARWKSDEARQAVSNFHKGRKRPPETGLRISASLKARNENRKEALRCSTTAP